MSTAWLTGVTGAWGGAFVRALLEAGYDVLALGRRDAPDLAALAGELGRTWAFVELDLSVPVSLADLRITIEAAAPGALQGVPDVLIHAAVSTDGDRATLAQTDYLAPAGLVDEVSKAMLDRGSGRIGVLVPQNARLGLAGLADVAAPQAALWTWCEAKRDELARVGDGVSLTIVIPPRTASATQRFVADRSGHSATLHPADARGLLRGVLAGRRRVGRRPWLAALAMLIR
jgi:NAD(P)-dependent dehydrogenase (short-subunit alcohol dehydrogenase family)